MRNLPILNGEGAHPPADACDFARYCSALDFWSINDHAEDVTPREWAETKESIRQCNDVAGDPANPDVVAYLGWEWTQTGDYPKEHFGHKNIVLLDTAEDKVPTRAIAAGGGHLDFSRGGILPPSKKFSFVLGAGEHRQSIYDMYASTAETQAAPICPEGVGVRELPANCQEVTPTPRGLFDKLDEWGFPAIVIPHGNAWGSNTPPAMRWEYQLANNNHDPNRQTMIEVYSGHGNSEEFRDHWAVEVDEEGNASCPEPSEDYKPGCQRAGEIIMERCIAAGLEQDECDNRAAEARQHFVDAGTKGAGRGPGCKTR